MTEATLHISTMKSNHISAFGWLAALLISGFSAAKAQDAVPCLIFTGNSDTPYNIDLDKLNRVTFGDDGFIVSSSSDSAVSEETLLYSLYNRLAIGEAVPSIPTSVADIEVEGSSALRYQADAKSIVLDAAAEGKYAIGIYSLNGVLIATSDMAAGQSLDVASLPAGSYIAVASNGNSKLTLKFILR